MSMQQPPSTPSKASEFSALMQRARTDMDFRQALISNPKKFLREDGIDVPDDLDIGFVDVSGKTWYLALPVLEDEFKAPNVRPKGIVDFVKKAAGTISNTFEPGTDILLGSVGVKIELSHEQTQELILLVEGGIDAYPAVAALGVPTFVIPVVQALLLIRLAELKENDRGNGVILTIGPAAIFPFPNPLLVGISPR